VAGKVIAKMGPEIAIPVRNGLRETSHLARHTLSESREGKITSSSEGRALRCPIQEQPVGTLRELLLGGECSRKSL
jgi:hypothetical protein